MKKLISLEIDSDIIDKLKEYAMEEDRSFSSVIRRILAEYIKTHEEKINKS